MFVNVRSMLYASLESYTEVKNYSVCTLLQPWQDHLSATIEQFIHHDWTLQHTIFRMTCHSPLVWLTECGIILGVQFWHSLITVVPYNRHAMLPQRFPARDPVLQGALGVAAPCWKDGRYRCSKMMVNHRGYWMLLISNMRLMMFIHYLLLTTNLLTYEPSIHLFWLEWLMGLLNTK